MPTQQTSTVPFTGEPILVREAVARRDIEACQRTIWSQYVAGMGWHPTPGNPSGLVEIPEQPCGRLADRFDNSCRWLAAWRGSQLLGCLRVILPDAEGLEVDRYTTLPPWIDSSCAVEVNRLAMDRRHRSSEAAARLFLAAFDLANELGASWILAASSFSRHQRIYDRIFLRRVPGACFRYEESDPRPAQLHAADLLRHRQEAERQLLRMVETATARGPSAAA